MSRMQVTEVRCDRCKRKENQVPEDGKRVSPELEMRYQDRVIKFDDLCTTCRDALANYVSRIAKDPPTQKGEIKVPQVEPVKKGLFR
jgi:hypothetical protein